MFDNRVTRLLGVEIPIVQAPMGWIARADLASAVSNAGAMGIIETSSGELDKGVALSGEVAGRIDSVRPVVDVITECVADCLTTLTDLADAYPPTAPGGRP